MVTQIEFEKENLPEGWIVTAISNITETVQKINPKDTPNKIFHYCDINSIDNSRLQITNPKQILGKNAPSRARQLIKKNDILFSTVRTYLKNIAMVPEHLNDNLASTGFCVIRAGKINEKFMFNYIQSSQFIDLINSAQRGISYPAVRNNDVHNSIIPLPPLNEQKRIVTKIESIFTQIDACKEELDVFASQTKSVSYSLQTLKGNILKQMFEELNKKHRADMLEKVCIDIQSGFAQGEKDVKNGIIHLRMNNIDTNFTMNFELLRTINATNKQKEKYLLQKNDILFVNTNSVELVGKSAIFTFDKDCLYSNHLTRLRTNISILDPKFLLYYFYYKWIKHDFRSICNKWINQVAINTTKIKQLQIPLPPLNEQKRIVTKIESIFDRIDVKQEEMKKIEMQLKSIPDSINTLKGSILKKAFEGKLVPQNPNDEHASVLLERIKSQKSRKI